MSDYSDTEYPKPVSPTSSKSTFEIISNGCTSNMKISSVCPIVDLKTDQNAYESQNQCFTCDATLKGFDVRKEKKIHCKFCYNALCSECSALEALHPRTQSLETICKNCLNAFSEEDFVDSDSSSIKAGVESAGREGETVQIPRPITLSDKNLDFETDASGQKSFSSQNTSTASALSNSSPKKSGHESKAQCSLCNNRLNSLNNLNKSYCKFCYNTVCLDCSPLTFLHPVSQEPKKICIKCCNVFIKDKNTKSGNDPEKPANVPETGKIQDFEKKFEEIVAEMERRNLEFEQKLEEKDKVNKDLYLIIKVLESQIASQSLRSQLRESTDIKINNENQDIEIKSIKKNKLKQNAKNFEIKDEINQLKQEIKQLKNSSGSRNCRCIII